MRTGKALHITLVVMIALFLIGHFLLNNKKIQQDAALHVVRIAQSALKTDVSAGRVQLTYPFGMSIEDLTVYDLRHDTLAHAASVSLRLKPFQLLRRKVSITSVRVNTPSIRLYTDSLGAEPNYAFLTALMGGGDKPMSIIENPAILRSKALPPNVEWMRTVTKEEAAKCKKHIDRWTEEDRPKGEPTGQGVGEWIYEEDKPVVPPKPKRRFQYAGPYKSYAEHMAAVEEMNRIEHEKQYGLKDSLTLGAKQLEWKTLCEFPQTPQAITETPLQDYLARLTKGAIYCKNQYSESPVYDAAMAEDRSHLAVVTEISGVTNYALSEVYFQDGFFVHKSIRTFFTEEGAQKYFTLSLGREWTGGDVMEDYC